MTTTPAHTTTVPVQIPRITATGKLTTTWTVSCSCTWHTPSPWRTEAGAALAASDHVAFAN